MTNRRILLIGATGVFGKRLALHLCRFAGIELVLTSRSRRKACQLAAQLAQIFPKAQVSGQSLDHRENLPGHMNKVRPWLVIDASGPFQGAGYNVPKAALEAGAHVVDLADARDYLISYAGALNDLAISKGLVAVAGASSTPALSSAAVAHLAKNWQRVDGIDIAITPAGRSEVGLAVVEAILSYAGKQVPCWEDGRLSTTTGWLKSKRIALPGLGKRNVAPVETMDAELLGSKFSVVNRVLFSAGLESRLEQIGIQLLARIVQAGWINNLRPFAPLLLMGRTITRIPTSDAGGMLVEVNGLDGEGRVRNARWSLLAENDHGPFVPVMPAAAMVRKLMENSCSAGAFIASDVLDLADITGEMTDYDISTIID